MEVSPIHLAHPRVRSADRWPPAAGLALAAGVSLMMWGTIAAFVLG